MRLVVGEPKADELIYEGRRIDVYLNGQLQDHVEIADEEEGYIVQAVVDERGDVQVANEQIMKQQRYGTVKIIIGPPRSEIARARSGS